jgi:DNA-binding NarL/FixJ family response regulator
MSRQRHGRVRLFVVHCYEVMRLGLRAILEREPHFEVVGDAGSAKSAVPACRQLQPHIVLMDARLRDRPGIDAWREIHDTSPSIRVIFVAPPDEDEARLSRLLAEGHGLMFKDIDGRSLVRAVEHVADGHSWIGPQATRWLVARVTGAAGRAAPGVRLSPQERRVLAEVAAGKTNKQIARALQLSDKTVKNYLSHVFQKLNVSRRSEAAARFARSGSSFG